MSNVVLLSVFWYLLLASMCFLCNWWSREFLRLYVALSTLLAHKHSCESFLVHHLLDLGMISSTWTSECIASCRALVSSLQHASSYAWFKMFIGVGVFASCFASLALKSSQFMFQKLRLVSTSMVFTSRLNSMWTGR